jgi:AcrR family transcriptional regulator
MSVDAHHLLASRLLFASMTSITRRRRLTQSERVAESGQRLMDSAIELFADKGFERTSASEIADHAGYSHSMVSARFGTKEALLEQLMHSEYERRMLPQVDPEAGIDGLLLWIDTIQDEIRTAPRHMRAFYTLVFEAVGPIPSLRPWVEDWLARCVRHAAACLTAARQAGQLRDDVDIDGEAELFVYSGVGLGYRFVYDSDLPEFAKALERWRVRFDNARKPSRTRSTRVTGR